ncbi:MAG: GTP cyclohydrolase IIa [Desulfurococcales archaeon]|nr:GTP cyclohydrolase IIa [Desulfurococcales archaeon]
MRIALVELVGYREWTESLGDDREWIIQAGQAGLYEKLQLAAARLGGFAFPLRYDYLLIIATGLGKRDLQEILDTIRLTSRLPVRMSSTAGTTPSSAVLRAQEMLKRTPAGELSYEPGNDGVTVLAHVDINDITGSTASDGIPKSLVVIADLVSGVTRLAYRHGGIAQYLGGDNVLVLLPDRGYEGFAQEVVDEFNVKVGIGVARLARTAMMLSSKALHEIRESRAKSNIHVIEEGVG